MGFGRREIRIGVAVSASRAIGSVGLILIASWVPAALLVPQRAEAACEDSPSAVHYYHFDHLGSVVVVTDETAALLMQIRYTPFGEIRGRFDAAGDPLVAPAWNRKEFTGYESEALGGLQYANARYYDPSTGQFLSPDPARQFANPYVYVAWDPINQTDPTGMFAGFGSGFDFSIVSFGSNDSLWNTPLKTALDTQSMQQAMEHFGPRRVAGHSGFGNAAGSAAAPVFKVDFDGMGSLAISDIVGSNAFARMMAIAKNANGVVSIVYGRGLGRLATFIALGVDPTGKVTLDLGLGIGGGNLTGMSLSGLGEVQAGRMSPLRLNFIAGGAARFGFIHRSSVSISLDGLTPATGGGILLVRDRALFVFVGPTVSFVLGQITTFGKSAPLNGISSE